MWTGVDTFRLFPLCLIKYILQLMMFYAGDFTHFTLINTHEGQCLVGGYVLYDLQLKVGPIFRFKYVSCI